MRLIVLLIFFLSIMVASSQSSPDSVRKDSSSEYTMKKSPTTAVLYSLAFPGLGQYYVESYWKIPIFVGGVGACLYGIISNNALYNQKSDEVQIAISDSASTKSINLLKSQREFYRDNRDLSGLYLIAVYVISAVDAYSGAHLYDFDVSDKLSIRLIPDFRQVGVMIQAHW